MRRVILILFFSLCMAFILGLIFHTSSHPQIFGKYTIKYISVLTLLILIFPISFWLVNSFLKTKSIYILGKKRTLSAIKKILLIIIFFIILISPFEIFLRDKYRNFESDNYQYTIDNFDPFLQSKIAKQENLTVNSLGFRGEEISALKPENTFRIVILGGSTVLNREVPFEKNASRLLEKKLREHFPGRKIEVINAGKDYYTSEHSLIQYMFKIADLKPDLVIMWHGINDMTESCTIEGVISHGSYKPDYSQSFGALSKTIFDHFHPQSLVQMKLVTMDFLLKALGDNLYSDIRNPLVDYFATKKAEVYMHHQNTIDVRSFPSIESYKRNLSYLIDITKKEGIPLILGNQPSLIKSNNSVDEVKKIMFPTIGCRKDGRYYDLESYMYGLNLFNNVSRSVAQEKGVLFIDLDKNIPKKLDYFLDMVHYTEKGNEKVADSIYNFILENQIVKN